MIYNNHIRINTLSNFRIKLQTNLFYFIFIHDFRNLNQLLLPVLIHLLWFPPQYFRIYAYRFLPGFYVQRLRFLLILTVYRLFLLLRLRSRLWSFLGTMLPRRTT